MKLDYSQKTEHQYISNFQSISNSTRQSSYYLNFQTNFEQTLTLSYYLSQVAIRLISFIAIPHELSIADISRSSSVYYLFQYHPQTFICCQPLQYHEPYMDLSSSIYQQQEGYQCSHLPSIYSQF